MYYLIAAVCLLLLGDVLMSAAAACYDQLKAGVVNSYCFFSKHHSVSHFL